MAYSKFIAAFKPTVKIEAALAYDIWGVLTTQKIPGGKTVTGEYYKEYIQKYLRQAIRKKRPKLFAEGLITLHDTATPHKTCGVTSLIDLYNWEILDHPPYSPDISACDYDIFPELKENMRNSL